jgi:Na+/proline symporter
MAGLVVAGLLGISLLVVHVSLRWHPLPPAEPLNVDTGLPLPEIGQASTVFSLSALFGAYFGVYLVLGLPALSGLAVGTIGALLLLRRWIDIHRPETFEALLNSVLGGDRLNSAAFVLTLSAVQCAFAASEMVILRSFTGASLGLRTDHAHLLAISLAVIAYFYVLFGGYLAVFRTDVVQFLFIALMIVIAGTTTAFRGFTGDWPAPITPRAGYWDVPSLPDGPLKYVLHFFFSGVMALGFLIASPDAWKRVFLVSRTRRTTSTRFAFFLLIGVAPFLLLVPMSTAVPRIPDGTLDANAVWEWTASNEGFFLIAALCLVASFLSAYNGALIMAVHLGLISWRKIEPTANETSRFHWLMVSALLTTVCLFVSMASFGNPYLLGNVLLGPYAILAGIYFGGRGSVKPFPKGVVPWILVVGLFVWILYLIPHQFIDATSTHQVNTVPVASLFVLITAVVCRILTIRRGSRV